MEQFKEARDLVAGDVVGWWNGNEHRSAEVLSCEPDLGHPGQYRLALSHNLSLIRPETCSKEAVGAHRRFRVRSARRV